MDRLEINSAAKINLTLDVLRKREDGFHDVKMIMQTVNLCDTINIDLTGSGISVTTNLSYLPKDEGNIAYKAAARFFEIIGEKGGVNISITKRIPVAAGLAGGSGNAAAVLKGLNTLYGNALNDEELLVLGGEIGSDVPYCIKGGTMLAEGRGEILSPLPQMPKSIFLLAKPAVNISTQWVYQNLDLKNVKEHPDTAGCINALEKNDLKGVAVRMFNVLETVTLTQYPVVDHIKKIMIDFGAMGSVMSGSGPTVFGMFDDEERARRAETDLRELTNDVYLVHTV